MSMSMSMRRPTAVVRLACGATLAAVGLAGCGGAQPPAAPGAAVFAAGCRTCHSLIGNESLHRVGGDLLGYRLGRAELLEFVREMPVAHPLTATQVAAVSDYVLGLERRAAATRVSAFSPSR
jgi:mono/diheme cytochrome c family protein